MNPFLRSYNAEGTDHELIHKALEGDRSALEQLLLRHQPFIYNIAWKLVSQPADAEDLTQEALIKITTSLGSFRFQSSFRTWAYRIVVNHFLGAQKRGREAQLSQFDDLAEGLARLPDHEMSAAEQLEHAQLIREMNLSCMSGMLLCLTREQRLVYILGEMLGADHGIGSELLGISKDNFRQRLSRARGDLYQFMNNKCGLVNAANPCRCHKKVQVVVASGAIDAKNLLHNRSAYADFRSKLAPDADYMFDEVDRTYAELFQAMTYREDFDKKVFIQDILEKAEWQQKLRLN